MWGERRGRKGETEKTREMESEEEGERGGKRKKQRGRKGETERERHTER